MRTRVTVPTPGPAAYVVPVPAAPRRTHARTTAPCVTSGSSPASFVTAAMATPSPSSYAVSANAGDPPGSSTRTGSGKRPVSSATYAARAAAVAWDRWEQAKADLGALTFDDLIRYAAAAIAASPWA